MKAAPLTPFVYRGLGALSPLSSSGVTAMNPTQCTQPQALFGASMHAGGWPKLGWETQEISDDGLSPDDDLDGQLEH